MSWVARAQRCGVAPRCSFRTRLPITKLLTHAYAPVIRHEAIAIDKRGKRAMTTTLVEQIEEMRIRMNQLARREQDLVRALGQALNRADQKLLQDVRNVALEHEVRREGILRELQAFAAHMGALPMPRQPYASLENAPIDAA